MNPVRAVQCICVEGFDEAFLQSRLDLATRFMQESGYGPEFVVWQVAGQRERRLPYKRAREKLGTLLSSSVSFHIFSIGIKGNRDLLCPFSYMAVDKSYSINRFLFYYPDGRIKPLAVMEALFRGCLCNGYIYEDDVLDSPPGYFAGVDYVGELGEANKPPFKKPHRIANSHRNLWYGIDPRLGYVTEIHGINIWSEATLQFPLGSATVRTYLEQNPIGEMGSSCGKFMIQLNDEEQGRLRRVFDAAKICLAGFDGVPPLDLYRITVPVH